MVAAAKKKVPAPDSATQYGFTKACSVPSITVKLQSRLLQGSGIR